MKAKTSLTLSDDLLRELDRMAGPKVFRSSYLKHDCAVHCDGLMSLEKSRLTDYVGELSDVKRVQLG